MLSRDELDTLITLSEKLEQQARAVADLKQSINDVLNRVNWEIHSSTKLDWDNHYSRPLDVLQQGLKELGRECERRLPMSARVRMD